MTAIKLLSKNKYLKVPLLYFGTSGGNIEYYNYIVLPKTSYIDTNIKDVEAIAFNIVYIPISLENSYQNYLASELDNFTFANYSVNRNYLRCNGIEISNRIEANWGTEHNYSYDNINDSLGNSSQNIIINNNIAKTRGGNQKLKLLQINTNIETFIFKPATFNNIPGVIDIVSGNFYAAEGESAYCTNE